MSSKLASLPSDYVDWLGDIKARVNEEMGIVRNLDAAVWLFHRRAQPGEMSPREVQTEESKARIAELVRNTFGRALGHDDGDGDRPAGHDGVRNRKADKLL